MSLNDRAPRRLAPWREKLHEIIFEADTAAGKTFDVLLLFAILASVVILSLETVDGMEVHRSFFVAAEWALTALFTVEYVLRLICVRRPLRYAISFFGVVDLLAILPTYLSLVIPGAQSLAVVRSLRFLRAFRVFKLGRMLREASVLRQAIWDSRGKVVVFLTTVVTVVTIAGPAMYWVENLDLGAPQPESVDRQRASDDGDSDSGRAERSQPQTQFTSIPQAMYWAIVTMTTVGYGDVVPRTTLGKFLSAILIIVGYSLIIVPTGFVSAELVGQQRRTVTSQACPECMAEGHDADARHCKYCGCVLNA